MEIDKRLSSLDPSFRAKVLEMIAQLAEKRIYVIIIETRRMASRQELLVQMGRSKTLKSKHLDGKAVDIAPVLGYTYPKVTSVVWDTKHSVWKEISRIGKSLGLKWGGDWRTFKDYVHWEDDD